jgi:hypothetical protein
MENENKNLLKQIQTFQNENARLKSVNKELFPQHQNLESNKQRINQLPSCSIELFKYLRQQCNDRNPHKAGLINLTASSICNNCDPCNIFEYSMHNFWISRNERNQWLLFDLKGLSFKVEKIRFNVNSGCFPIHWRLLGSDNNQTWVTIHDQGRDTRMYPSQDIVITFFVQTNDFFTHFKFEQLHQNYNDDFSCALYSVEFIGRLNSK